MNLHFGFNCRHFIPSMGKCRRAISDLAGRRELRTLRWVTAKEAMVYLELTPEQLVESTATEDIKPIKDGMVLVRINVEGTWDWDDCPLTRTGGQCGSFDQHSGPKISYAMEIQTVGGQHPNRAFEPDGETVAQVEGALVRRVTSGLAMN